MIKVYRWCLCGHFNGESDTQCQNSPLIGKEGNKYKRQSNLWPTQDLLVIPQWCLDYEDKFSAAICTVSSSSSCSSNTLDHYLGPSQKMSLMPCCWSFTGYSDEIKPSPHHNWHPVMYTHTYDYVHTRCYTRRHWIQSSIRHVIVHAWGASMADFPTFLIYSRCYWCQWRIHTCMH